MVFPAFSCLLTHTVTSGLTHVLAARLASSYHTSSTPFFAPSPLRWRLLCKSNGYLNSHLDFTKILWSRSGRRDEECLVKGHRAEMGSEGSQFFLKRFSFFTQPKTSSFFRTPRPRITLFWGSLCLSGKLPTYPSPKPTFSPKREVSVNVGLGEG